MTYRLGIDVGPTHTTWAVIAGAPDRAPDTGSIDSVVTLVHRDDVIMARDFVDKLGQSEPLIIGGTPYGVEALVSKLVAGVVGSARQRQGEEPAAVVLVHPDGLDPYRAGLYAEALRLTDVAANAAFVVSQSEARAANPAADAAVGGAAVGWQRVPTPVDEDSGIAGPVVMGSGAAGAVVIATLLGEGLDGGAALSSAAGPQGIGLAQPGPAGAPLGTSGPAGMSLPGSGATTGAPLSGPPAPPGTPLAAPGTSPPPLSGPPAPADTPTTATPTTGGTPPPPPPPGGPGGAGGRFPEASVRPGTLELAPVSFWRRWWFFPVAFVAVLFIAVPVVFLMGRGEAERSVVPASTVARVVASTTTARPPASVLAPPSSAAATTSAATTSTSSTTTTSTTLPATTTTVARTTVPRTTVPATIPPTTVAPTTIPPNTPPVINSFASSQGTLPTCATSSTTLTVNVADNSGVSSVAVNYSYAVDKITSTSGSVLLTGAAAGGMWSGTFTMTTPTTYGATPVTLTAVVTDNQGSSTSFGPTQQYLIAQKPPIC